MRKVSLSRHCGTLFLQPRRSLRQLASPHLYNTEEEIDRVLERLE
jgi:selenocysteine lyase/cysteine desulfurase